MAANQKPTQRRYEDSVGRAADVEFCVWTLLSYLQVVSGPVRARGEEQPKRQM